MFLPEQDIWSSFNLRLPSRQFWKWKWNRTTFCEPGASLFKEPGSIACLLLFSVSLNPRSHLWSPSSILGRRVRFSSVSARTWLGCIISVFHYKNTETVMLTAEARVRMTRNQHGRDSQHSTDTKQVLTQYQLPSFSSEEEPTFREWSGRTALVRKTQ